MTDGFVCGLCSYFNEANVNEDRILITQDVDGVCGALLKHCKFADSLVHLTFCSCSNFLPTRFFLCVTRDEIIDSATCCRGQIDNPSLECLDCIQGQMVLSMLRGGSKRWEKAE